MPTPEEIIKKKREMLQRAMDKTDAQFAPKPRQKKPEQPKDDPGAAPEGFTSP